MRQAEKNRRLVELNEFQLYLSICRAKFVMAVVGRGGGKTTGRGDRWSNILSEMPRSTGLFIGPSYQAILTRILPSLKQGLEMFGIYENLHYFVGRQPPRSWRNSWGRAYQPPDKWDRYITFWNGVGVHLISHDLPNDGKGLNSDWADGDEAALLDPAKLQENTDPTIRGTNTKAFEKSAFFGSKFYSTSMPLTPAGRYVLEYKQKCLLNPKEYNYLSFPCLVNYKNLRKGFLKEAERDAIYRWMFLAEYMNVEPKFVKDGFYPLLDEDIHAYEDYDYTYYTERGKEIDCRGDSDLVAHLPLIMGVDWGATINCLVALQHVGKEIRALKSMFVLGDLKEVQSDLFEKFNKYYRHHPTKRIFLFYDNSGNNETGITKFTRAQLAKKQLESYGWIVTLKTIGGRNPEHGKKHILWNAILKENTHFLPVFRMNKHNCKELWISMFNAQAIQSGRGDEIKKDKTDERKKNSTILRQHATDLSDAIDSAIFGMFYHQFTSRGTSIPEAKSSSR